LAEKRSGRVVGRGAGRIKTIGRRFSMRREGRGHDVAPSGSGLTPSVGDCI
jgi:hypothetical protein